MAGADGAWGANGRMERVVAGTIPAPGQLNGGRDGRPGLECSARRECGRRIMQLPRLPGARLGRLARGLPPSPDVWSAHWRRCRSVPAPFQRPRVGCKPVFMGLWPPCNMCSLQACSGSLGLAGTARARPATLAPYMERALASPPLRSSSDSACSVGVSRLFFWVCGRCLSVYVPSGVAH